MVPRDSSIFSYKHLEFFNIVQSTFALVCVQAGLVLLEEACMAYRKASNSRAREANCLRTRKICSVQYYH